MRSRVVAAGVHCRLTLTGHAFGGTPVDVGPLVEVVTGPQAASEISEELDQGTHRVDATPARNPGQGVLDGARRGGQGRSEIALESLSSSRPRRAT